MSMHTHPLADKFLARRGQKSMSLIADEFGVTRNVVAGVFFRASHPKTRSLGTGYRTGERTPESKLIGGKIGRKRWSGLRKSLEKIVVLCHDEENIVLNFAVILEVAEGALAFADKKAAHTAAFKRRKSDEVPAETEAA